RPGRVALLGVSPMTRRCAGVLSEARVPLLIVNRTLEAADELAGNVAGEAMPLDRFRIEPPPLDALVLATGGGEPVLDAAALARLKGSAGLAPLIIDFGVPPNVDPATAQRAGLARVGMSDLIEAAQGRRLAQLVRLAPVRHAIDERLTHLRSELATRAIGPRLADLRGAFEQIAAEEVAGSLRPRSAELYRRACRVIPGGVNSPVRAFRAVGGTPLFIARAAGAQVFDADGRGYLDFVGSWGPLIAGHAHPAVNAAVSAALERGTTYGAPCEAEVELAERVVGWYPAVEQVRCVSSGTEAVMSAIRVARAFTGRDLIVKFAGCYHG